MKSKSAGENISYNNIDNHNANNIFLNNSNITGFSSEKYYLKREKKGNNNKNNIAKSVIYKTLPKNAKIEYIHKLIKKPISKEPFDFLAVKRKKSSIINLIHQFDDSTQKSNIYEKNNISFLYSISNRKLVNNSSNLLLKILETKDKKLTKKEEKIIKNSSYSKIFSTEISELINNKNQNKNKTRSKSCLRKNNNHLNNDNYSQSKNFPFLNKFIKSKFNNYMNDVFNRNNYINSYHTSIGFFKNPNNQDRCNSAYSVKYDEKEKNENKKRINIIKNIKNKKMSLYNYKSNVINNSIINERNNRVLREIFYRKRKNKSDQRFNEVIKGISNLKYNNQILPFYNRINLL